MCKLLYSAIDIQVFVLKTYLYIACNNLIQMYKQMKITVVHVLHIAQVTFYKHELYVYSRGIAITQGIITKQQVLFLLLLLL